MNVFVSQDSQNGKNYPSSGQSSYFQACSKPLGVRELGEEGGKTAKGIFMNQPYIPCIMMERFFIDSLEKFIY